VGVIVGEGLFSEKGPIGVVVLDVVIIYLSGMNC